MIVYILGMVKVMTVMMITVTMMMMTYLEPGSCDLDRLTGFAILSLRKPADPLTLDADRASPEPVPILTIETPSSTKVSSRLLLFALLLLLGLLALSWRFVG